MKKFLLALMVALTTCTLAIAQNNTTPAPVIGMDTEDADSIEIDGDSSSVSYGSADFSVDTDSDDFPFNEIENVMSSGIQITTIVIIAVFGLPMFTLFVVFFFRYKNRKARYRLAEQALAAGQPLPADFIRENNSVDQSSQGIKNTFTGIGLFIFLWAITGEFGIGAVGLLVAFMGVGQWIIDYKQQQNKPNKDKSEEEK